MENKKYFTSIEDVPVIMNAADLAKFLGISKANAYTLMHRADFPTIHIGSRMLVKKDRLLSWLDLNAPKDPSFYDVEFSPYKVI